MTASDISYLSPNQSIRGVVSNSDDKYKIYEFNINRMQFPDPINISGGVDLFVTLTPCIGMVQFYISDKMENLFTDSSEQTTNHKISALDTSDQKVEIIHKKSKVSVDQSGEKLNLE